MSGWGPQSPRSPRPPFSPGAAEAEAAPVGAGSPYQQPPMMPAADFTFSKPPLSPTSRSQPATPSSRSGAPASSTQQDEISFGSVATISSCIAPTPGTPTFAFPSPSPAQRSGEQQGSLRGRMAPRALPSDATPTSKLDPAHFGRFQSPSFPNSSQPAAHAGGVQPPGTQPPSPGAAAAPASEPIDPVVRLVTDIQALQGRLYSASVQLDTWKPPRSPAAAASPTQQARAGAKSPSQLPSHPPLLGSSSKRGAAKSKGEAAAGSPPRTRAKPSLNQSTIDELPVTGGWIWQVRLAERAYCFL